MTTIATEKPKRSVIDIFMRLLIVRTNLDMSQQELATRAGLSRNTVSNIENGKKYELGTLIVISDALEVPPHTWLLPDIEWLQWLTEWLNSEVAA